MVFLNLRACECGLNRRCCSKSLARVDAGGVKDSTIEYLLDWWRLATAVFLTYEVYLPVPFVMAVPLVVPPRSWLTFGMTTVSAEHAEQLDRLLFDRRSNRNIIFHENGGMRVDAGAGVVDKNADRLRRYKADANDTNLTRHDN